MNNPTISKFNDPTSTEESLQLSSPTIQFKKEDIEKGAIKDVLFMSLGPASGHGIYVDDIMLNSFLKVAENKSKVRVHLSHESFLGGFPKELLYIGNASKFYRKNDGVYGNFNFSPAAESNPFGDFKKFVSDRIKENEMFFGFSAHVRRKYRTMEEAIDDHIESATITDIFSIDLVEDPATTTSLYFSTSFNNIKEKLEKFNSKTEDGFNISVQDQLKILGPEIKKYLQLNAIEDSNNSKGQNMPQPAVKNKNEPTKNDSVRERLETLTKLSKKYDMTQEQITEYTFSEKTIDSIIFELDEKFTPKKQDNFVNTSFQITTDEQEKKFSQFEKAILFQRGIKTKEKIDPKGLNEHGYIGLQSLFRLCAQYNGRFDLINIDSTKMMDSLFASSTHAQGSDDFVNILSNVLNKSLLSGYDFQDATFEKVCGRMSFNDFKTNDMTRMTEYDTYTKLPEGLGPEFGQFKDNKEQARLDTHGTKYILSRKAMVNDDMGAFTIIAAAMMRGLKRYQNQIFWDIVFGTAFAGPSMIEVSNLFSTTIGNLITPASGAAPSITTLDTAWKYFARLTSQSPKEGAKPIYINARPQYMVHAPEDGLLINQLTQSAYYNISDTIKEGSLITNIHADGAKRNFIPIEEAYLETFDATNKYPWYLFSDPNALSTMQYLTLRGAEAPYTLSEPTPSGEARGIMWVVEHDFAFAPADYRGIYCNPGPQ